MDSRMNCFDMLPTELFLGVVSTLDFGDLSVLITVNKIFSTIANVAFYDRQKKMTSLFQHYQKATSIENLKIENVDDVIFWFTFIPHHVSSLYFQKLSPPLRETELLLLSLLLCELMLYLTEKKIIQFNSIKGYVRKLVEREYIPMLVDEYETEAVLGQLSRDDVMNIKKKIIQKTNGNYLVELLDHIKYMKTDCLPSPKMARLLSFFSKYSDDKRKLWNMVDKCVGVLDGSVILSVVEEEEEEELEVVGLKS